MITKINLQPFVVTLCGLLIYRGVARWIASDKTQGFGSDYDDSFRLLATGDAIFGSLGDDCTRHRPGLLANGAPFLAQK